MAVGYPVAVAFLIQFIVGVPSILARSELVFDAAGAVTFIACALLSYLMDPRASHWRGAAMTFAVFAWALRLGSFLFGRIHATGFDRRFERIRNNPIKFFVVWMLQGGWIALVSLPLWLVNLQQGPSRPLGLTDGLGVFLWVVGFAVEVAADSQKQAFRNEAKNQDKFIDIGLWAWSRHPNYLGEIMLWTGLYLVALPELHGWGHIAVASPLFTAYLLTRVSGVPPLEKHADAKWGSDPKYLWYKANTAVLVPFVY